MYTLWVKRRSNLLKVLLVAVTAMLAAWLLALVGTAKPAAATFPGQNGKIAYSRWDGTDSEIYTTNSNGTEETQLTNNTTSDFGPTWSPDGSKIAYMRRVSGQAEIYTINPDGTEETQLTNNTTSDLWPTWSPDGSKIAYQGGSAPDYDIYTIPATGGTATFLTRGSAPDWQPLPAPARPDSKSECKDGGYEEFGFKNYGQCIASVQRATKTSQ
jgi:Tol biopolymer transport system component